MVCVAVAQVQGPDLPLETLNAPQPLLSDLSGMSGPSGEAQLALGRYGEEFVFHYLAKKHGDSAKVTWMNESSETGYIHVIHHACHIWLLLGD